MDCWQIVGVEEQIVLAYEDRGFGLSGPRRAVVPLLNFILFFSFLDHLWPWVIAPAPCEPA